MSGLGKFTGSVTVKDPVTGEKANVSTKTNGKKGVEVLAEFSGSGPGGTAEISLADGPQLDSFGRLRVSNPFIRFDASFTIDDKAFLFSDETASGGTVTRDGTAGTMEISASSANGSRALRQTREYIKYIPGISPLIKIAGKFGTGRANAKQRVGLFDDDNGLFFEEENGTVRVVIRSNTSGSVVEDPVDQSLWNMDKLDGTGESGITLDLSKIQIFLIDFQWLSAGRVRFGFVIAGKLYYVHEFYHANIDTEKYMQTASLPLRAEVINSAATSGTTTFHLFCLSYIQEGVLRGPTRLSVATRGTSIRQIVNSEYRPIVSIRLQSGKAASIIPKAISYLVTSADPSYLELRINPTLSNGTNWQDVPGSNLAQFDIGSADVANGDVIWADYVYQRVTSNIDLDTVLQRIGVEYDGTRDILSLVAISLNNNANAYGAIKFEEDY